MSVMDGDAGASLQLDPWTALEAELAVWAAAGRRATFWWRDDDATGCGEQLSRLLDVAGATPLTLAVIPASARDELGTALEDHRAAGGRVLVAQHGYAHFNHAPPAEKSAEYGPHRPTEVMLAELAKGCGILTAMFDDAFRPVLAPPWNRIAPSLAPRLGEAGLVGLSAFGTRPPGNGPIIVNTHIDIIDWRRDRGFAGERAVLGTVASHLRARRTGLADPAVPTGLLTHHLDHDAASWRFVRRFVAVIDSHPAGFWTDGLGKDVGLS